MALSHQLPARLAGGGGEGQRPQVLVDDQQADRVGAHRRDGGRSVLVGEDPRRRPGKRTQVADLGRIEVGGREGVEVAGAAVHQHQHVEDANQPPVDEVEQRWNQLTADLAVGRLDEEPADRTGVMELSHQFRSLPKHSRTASCPMPGVSEE